MRRWNSSLGRAVAAALALVVTTWLPPGRAQQPPELVVARVGSRTITSAELERRLSQLAPFQLRTLGKTPEEIRRVFLEKVLIREALFAEGAAAEQLGERDEVGERLRRVLRRTLLALVRADVARDQPVTDADVQKYYEENRARFVTPQRIAIWRILVDKREEAKALIDELKKDPSQKHWNDVARDKSLDKATYMRGGNLGFVAADGTTNEPGVRVDVALFVAAARVPDAEIVSEPVAEGARFAVVWRRQSMKPIERTVEMEAPSIRQVIAHARTEEATRALVERLRKEQLSESHPEVLDQLDITSSGEIQPLRRPGVLGTSRRPSAGSPVPTAGPGGLR